MWCLIAFILTFFITRTITRYIPRDRRPDRAEQVVAAAQHLRKRRTAYPPRRLRGDSGADLGVAMVTMSADGTIHQFTAAAIVFGIGAALVLDEFALILHLQDVYWSADGRTSVDAVFVAVAVSGLLVLGFNPLSLFEVGIWRDADSTAARATVLLLALLNLALAVLVLLRASCGPVCWACSSPRCYLSGPSDWLARTPVGPVALPGQTTQDAPLARA